MQIMMKQLKYYPPVQAYPTIANLHPSGYDNHGTASAATAIKMT
jgi:hypothetical protein